MKNSIGREIPEKIVGYDKFKCYCSPFIKEPVGRKASPKLRQVKPGDKKVVNSLEEAIKKAGLKDGMTISFHHHFRNGDYIINMVMDKIAEMGIKDITIAPSSLTTVHETLVEHVKSGVISGIYTSGVRGKLAEEISKGIMEKPIIIRSHGGRARAIEAGEIHIDVAFLGVPSCDEYGNASGKGAKTICGSLGYAKVDAKYADTVVLITDDLVCYPNFPASISQTDVDYVVVVDSIGDPNGIASGATRYTKNPKELLIAKYASKVIVNSGYFKEGFSFQTGSGGSSLAVTRFLKEIMKDRGIKAKFALGGITKPMVELYEEGLIEHLFDTQTFDLVSCESIFQNPNHHEIDASMYANPHNKGSFVNKLDVVILSALEIDTSFNVNVITGSDGVIRGASGGHSDTAAGSKMSIIVAPLIRGRIPTVVDNVNTVVTPGETVDVLVTDRGIAINPKRKDLMENLKNKGLPIVTIEELRDMALKIAGKPKPIEYTDKVVGVVEYRDGSIIDVIRQIK
ncbi:citrate lyase subunit alpha [Paramaledivibacter caminithermalis]|uniref:Citrate lyase alpha chain n=1 Tax=Paramaledivibacter caminithermalis (strain DSM 15212 / CIP 107654 / DViRD3) TaxID=1121301 RepID=A0A1M6PCI0_PARC5|nr:citrate lyase subunit alpha [Paramaledivibacter caminithermalis]SHK05663.1 citrate lyase subunit alpha / citrate CoA-transferase [Paramaledivibacter caminithermalis DSM 15212]